ncbi:gamma-tubulin complex component 6, partial [Oryzias melastigma]|uniref:gamma-tubulin complex component 6 n=1 Tax=Oryzias melastigma TaxID=30732 RepID=UPI00168D65E3
VSLVNKAVVDYFFVEIGVEKHFEVLRHFLLMEDGEFAQSLSDLLFEKMVSGQTPGELLTPLVLNSILSKALQYSLHGDTPLAANFTFALRFLPETFHPHAPDSLNCLELRYKVRLMGKKNTHAHLILGFRKECSQNSFEDAIVSKLDSEDRKEEKLCL